MSNVQWFIVYIGAVGSAIALATIPIRPNHCKMVRRYWRRTERKDDR